MTTELLACPFCGGEAAIGLTDRKDERSGYAATYSAYCKTCGGLKSCTSNTDKNGWNNESDDSIKRRVREAWNRRAASQAPSIEGLREKVARICGGSTVENMGTRPFEGDANDLDWSSWQFADAILALLARSGE